MTLSDYKVKTCPFCGGGDVTMYLKTKSYPSLVIVQCNICGSESKPAVFDGVDDDTWIDCSACRRAISAWNRRPEWDKSTWIGDDKDDG